MPVLRDFRKTIKVTLPSTGGTVWIYDCILAQDSLEIDKIYVSDTEVSVQADQQKAKPISLRASKYYEAMDATLEAMVAKWDFTDEEGKEIPSTPENIKKLPKIDFEFLQKEVEGRILATSIPAKQKKN